MSEPLETRVSAVAALDEPTRRRLYDHVVRQSQPVSRDEAAEALQLPRTTAAFHLDRLADAGLLDVVYERRTGRSGPGAGRPSKLYRRSTRQLTVSVPERRYDLAGRLLAATLEEAGRSGEPPQEVLVRRAYEVGREFGSAARPDGDQTGQDAVLRLLEEYGFEPRVEDGEVLLGNCPFHALAQDFTELVCGMNLHLLDGVLDGLSATGYRARLAPGPDHCCVRLEPTGTEGRP
ncbi:helix-turn-helix domain-containing protein [Nonomuraea sp. NPDC049649]|uniref:helix-turn-helix transcriptional regulator n=1 Tax=Nonomuraea sp. NPDC049649 TaxID=3155776 RepID=UPI003418574B